MTGLVAVIMFFSICVIGIITDHLQKQSKLKQSRQPSNSVDTR
ncbi:hypothetical protein [Niallia sp. 03133]